MKKDGILVLWRDLFVAGFVVLVISMIGTAVWAINRPVPITPYPEKTSQEEIEGVIDNVDDIDPNTPAEVEPCGKNEYCVDGIGGGRTDYK